MFFGDDPNPDDQIPETITARWLQQTINDGLKSNRFPLDGIVIDSEISHHHSRIVFFHAQDPTSHWVGKIRTDFEGHAEGGFYQLANDLGITGVLPDSAGFVDLSKGTSLLLLENLRRDCRLLISDDQVFSSGQWCPSEPALNQVIAHLARFHGDWWDNEHLQTRPKVFARGGWWNRDEDFAEDRERRSMQVETLCDSETLSESVGKMLERSMDSLPEISERLTQSPLTCVHGDCYPWHFFISRQDQSIKLFDLEFVGSNTPAHDLMALLSYWQGDIHRVLQHYHTCLSAQGVKSYSLEMLEQDCLLAIYGHALMAVQDWQRGCSEGLWKNKLNNLALLWSAIRPEETS